MIEGSPKTVPESFTGTLYQQRMCNEPSTDYISRHRTSRDQLRKMGRGCCSPRLLLLQVIGQILLVIKQADSSPANKTIHIGYLLESRGRAGAINVAIEQAQNDGLLREYNFRYK